MAIRLLVMQVGVCHTICQSPTDHQNSWYSNTSSKMVFKRQTKLRQVRQNA